MFISIVSIIVGFIIIYKIIQPKKKKNISYKVAFAGAVDHDDTYLTEVSAPSLSDKVFECNGILIKASEFIQFIRYLIYMVKWIILFQQNILRGDFQKNRKDIRCHSKSYYHTMNNAFVLN